MALVRAPWRTRPRCRDDRLAMQTARAQTIAVRSHAVDRESSGALVIEHVRRVAAATPEEARAVAWLHEALHRTALTQHRPYARALLRLGAAEPPAGVAVEAAGRR